MSLLIDMLAGCDTHLGGGLKECVSLCVWMATSFGKDRWNGLEVWPWRLLSWELVTLKNCQGYRGEMKYPLSECHLWSFSESYTMYNTHLVAYAQNFNWNLGHLGSNVHLVALPQKNVAYFCPNPTWTKESGGWTWQGYFTSEPELRRLQLRLFLLLP